MIFFGSFCHMSSLWTCAHFLPEITSTACTTPGCAFFPLYSSWCKTYQTTSEHLDFRSLGTNIQRKVKTWMSVRFMRNPICYSQTSLPNCMRVSRSNAFPYFSVGNLIEVVKATAGLFTTLGPDPHNVSKCCFMATLLFWWEGGKSTQGPSWLIGVRLFSYRPYRNTYKYTYTNI